MRAVLAAAVLACTVPATAGDTIQLYGAENTGTAGAQFLKIPAGARAVGLARAYVACAIDGPAAFWNPAGLMRTPGRVNVFATHDKYTADIDIDHASLHWRGQNFGYAVSAAMLRSGPIPRTTELHVEGTGETFDADQYVLAFSLARAMTDRFSVGLTAKYYQENLDEWETRTALFDLGLLYFVGLGDLRVGFAVRNFGPDLRPGGSPPDLGGGHESRSEFQSHSPPTEGTFGAAATFDLLDGVDLLAAADFNHPSDAAETLRLGGELGFWRLLYVRGGYEVGRDEGGLAAGFGLQLKRKQLLWRIDYGYSDMGSFGTIHHVSLELSPLWRGEGRRHGRAR